MSKEAKAAALEEMLSGRSFHRDFIRRILRANGVEWQQAYDMAGYLIQRERERGTIRQSFFGHWRAVK